MAAPMIRYAVKITFDGRVLWWHGDTSADKFVGAWKPEKKGRLLSTLPNDAMWRADIGQQPAGSIPKLVTVKTPGKKVLSRTDIVGRAEVSDPTFKRRWPTRVVMDEKHGAGQCGSIFDQFLRDNVNRTVRIRFEVLEDA